MRLNIAHKIFGIACIVLAFMLVVAVYSIHLTATISKELETIAHKNLPVTEAVSRVNVSILEQGLLLQRLFVFGEPKGNDRDFFVEIGKTIKEEFQATQTLLDSERGDNQHLVKAISVLKADIAAIEREYLAFEAHGLLLLAAREAGQNDKFSRLFPQLNERQDSVDQEISGLHAHVQELTGWAVERTAKNEKFLLFVNSLLTGLAALSGLGVAALITRSLVRNVRNLVTGTQAVEGGDLDSEVKVATDDEIGKLTESFNHMVGELRLKERIKETFGKYMDPRIVSNLLDHPEFTEPGGERREMTVMFIDLKGFTSISEILAPDDLVHMINSFFGHMTDAISKNNGVVDKFMGDAVMAYWGPPFTDPDEHAALACTAALEALRHLEKFRQDVRRGIGKDADGLDIDLRIGISSGQMIVGTVGSRASMNYTIMGDPVNLGSRLEGANKAYGTRILVSERTRELAKPEILSREIDVIRVKGKLEPVRVHELLGDATDRNGFTDGLDAYRNQDWGKAETSFRKLPDDPASQVYLQRIAQLRTTPPPSDWDGVWVFETK